MKVKFGNVKQLRPDVDDGVRVPYPAARRVFPKLRWYLILAMVLSPFLYLGANALWGGILVQAPGLVDVPQNEMRAPFAGRIVSVDVQVGQPIEPGQALVTFSAEAEMGKRALVQSQIESLSVGPSRADATATIAALAETAHAAERVVASKRERLQKMQYLVNQGAATDAEINLARAQVEEAELGYKRARADWIARREANSQPDGTERRAALALLEQESANLDRERASRVITATGRGTILSVAVRPGEYIEAGSALVTVRDPGDPVAVAFLDPKYGSFARVGADVTLRYPDGSSATSRIVAIEENARKLPAQLQGPFSAQKMALVVKVAIAQDVGAQYRVHGLPVEVMLGRAMPSWWPF